MNEMIFIILFVAITLNLFSFLVGIGEFIWYKVIMQEDLPGYYTKWQKLKYQQMFDVNDDGDAWFAILLDMIVFILGVLVFGFLGTVGLLFPLVLICGAVYAARKIVEMNKTDD